MKTSSLITAFFLFLLLSCSYREELPKSTNHSVVDVYEGEPLSLNVVYDDTIQNGKLFFNLSVKDYNSELVSLKESVDISAEGYKINVNKKVIDIASRLINKVDKNQSKAIINSLLYQIEELEQTRGSEYLHNELNQGIFFYLSSFQTLNRFYVKSNNLNSELGLECTTNGAYVVGLAPFVAQEDVHFDVKDLRNTVSGITKSDKISVDELNVVKEVLAKLDVNTINLIDLQQLITADIARHVKGSASARAAIGFLQGGDCGCCGNYSGMCWFSSTYCFLHDAACQTCTPSWYCLSGCKPTRCS